MNPPEPVPTKAEPVLEVLPRPVADYVYYPDGHAKAGQIRVYDGMWLLAAVVIIQVLVMAWTAFARRAVERQKSSKSGG